MYEAYGIKVLSHNLFSPNLRERKVVVPTRSGAFDYGAEYHDERNLKLDCTTWKKLTTNEFDNLKWLLSKKGRVVLWDQPDRFYYGRVYEQDIVQEYFQQIGRSFTLTFKCEPYAKEYDAETGSEKPTILKASEQTLSLEENSYLGTWETPTRITI